MPDPDILVAVGFKVQDLLAGLAGGVVNALVFQRSNPMAIISSVVVGSLTANYLAEYAAKYVGLNVGAAAFITGLCAMAICQALVAAAAKWSPKLPGGPVNGP